MNYKEFIRQYRWYFLISLIIPPLSFIGLPLWIYGLILNKDNKDLEVEKNNENLLDKFPNAKITPNRGSMKTIYNSDNLNSLIEKFFTEGEEIKYLFLPSFYILVVTNYAIYLYNDKKMLILKNFHLR